jgi:hypothetical protein
VVKLFVDLRGFFDLAVMRFVNKVRPNQRPLIFDGRFRIINTAV